jgi:hypothetical protein
MLSLLVACAVGSLEAADAPRAKEHEVKAAFLYNFLRFVQWPESAFTNAQAPFVMGIIGDDACYPLLVAAQARRVDGRPLKVIQVSDATAAKVCHLLFVPASAEASAAKLLPARGVLTVGESEEFFGKGGMIKFHREQDKLRFAINVGAAERAGLKISAQLQKLASQIRAQK